MKFSCVVFDLDGTLVQSAETIYLSTIESFDRLNISYKLPYDKFNTMIGWHFEDIFDEVGIKVNDFEEFIQIYKSVYFDFIDKSTLYDDVEMVVKYLNENNIKVALLTTKGQDQADLIVDYFGLGPYFDYVMGRRPGIKHKPAAEPLEIICRDLNVKTGSTLIVGDTEMDIRCGKNAGAFTCGVTYGYRSLNQIENEAPNYTIRGLSELKNIIANNY